MTSNDEIRLDRVDPAWAWRPYAPDAHRPWTLALAGHLFRRAGFGADWSPLRRALADGPQKTIDRLLAPDGDLATYQGTYDEYDASAAGGEPGIPSVSKGMSEPGAMALLAASDAATPLMVPVPNSSGCLSQRQASL